MTTRRAKAAAPGSRTGQNTSPKNRVDPIVYAGTGQTVSVDLGLLTGLESLIHRLPDPGHPLHDEVLTHLRQTLTLLVQDGRAQRAQAGK